MKKKSVLSWLGLPFRLCWRVAKNILKKVRVTVKYAILAYKRRKSIYYIVHWRRSPIRPKTILWESFYGRGLLDNPYALFRAMLDNPDYADYQHIWVLDNLAYHADTLRRYAKHKNVRFVGFQSYAYLRALATSEFLVNNVSFWAYFIKRPGQTYINTWHGIPLKTIGADDNRLEATNMVRNFLQADYLVSANAFLSDIYRKSFQLGSLFRGEIIEEGYPRLDTLVKTDRRTVLEALRTHGVALSEGRKIILYAPTWRGKYEKPEIGVEAYLQVKNRIESVIDTQRYQVLIKPHQVVYNAARTRLDRLDCMIPATFDANVILAVTDVLVSDYSSIFFDFLETGRPILFYIPDLSQYAQSRGLYAKPEDLPGPVFETPEALADGLARLDEVVAPHQAKYARLRAWATFNAPGQIADTIVSHICRQTPAKVATPAKARKTIAIFADLLRTNGITTSLINLLNIIDYERYDVTVLTNYETKGDLARALDKMTPNVRVFSRKNVFGRTFLDELRLHVYNHRGYATWLGRRVCPWHYFREECLRYFGGAQFDCAIDFVGYAIFYESLALACGAKRHLIWAHSDMCAEQAKKMKWLTKVFSLYPCFDALVSCSESLQEKNRLSLERRGVRGTFLACKNLVYTERIRQGLAHSRTFEEDGRQYLLAGTLSEKISMLKAIPLFGETEEGVVIPHPLRFIMVGRLSPEKNLDVTIRAFATFLQSYPRAVLYIVGDGPLKAALVRLVTRLGVEAHIVFTGLLDNPAELMAQCDCFVLTSLYEGQPMVIHEARVAHMPIIMSTFATYHDAIVENGQYLVEPTEESIVDGFRAFAEGRVLHDYVYDPDVYNQAVLAHFERLAVGEIDGLGKASQPVVAQG